MEFKSLVENQKGLKIKSFRSDNGGEFCNTNFEHFLVKNGILHQKQTHIHHNKMEFLNV